MPLPWKKSKSGRISRFVSDLQQSPKHGGSLVVETGFLTSLIDLFVKNRDRLNKPSSKCSHLHLPRRCALSPPLQRRRSLPQKPDPTSVTEIPSFSKIEESFADGLTTANQHDGDEVSGGRCVLMVVVFKVFVVVVLALSTKKLDVGTTLSAFALLFVELLVARVFTLLNLCPDAQFRLDSLIGKLIGKEKQEESPSKHEISNKVLFEIIKESCEEIRVPQAEKKSNWDDSSSKVDKATLVAAKKEVLTIRDVVFKNEKSKSSKLKSKIVPKMLRSYKKKNKKTMAIKEEKETVTEVSSLISEEIIESKISERDDVGSNPPLLERCGVNEEEENEVGSKGDLTKAMLLIVIVLVGLLSGKVLAIGLTLSWCFILTVLCCKSQTSL